MKPDNAKWIYKVYHGTKEPFSKFDVKKGAQGIGWFTDNIEQIKNGDSGAASSKVILPCLIKIQNPAGWKEYEMYGIGQLKNMGYDGIILPDSSDGSNTYVVFKNNQVKILKEQLEKLTGKKVELKENVSLPEIFSFRDLVGNQRLNVWGLDDIHEDLQFENYELEISWTLSPWLTKDGVEAWNPHAKAGKLSFEAITLAEVDDEYGGVDEVSREQNAIDCSGYEVTCTVENIQDVMRISDVTVDVLKKKIDITFGTNNYQ
jgi:hypothetical protein